ncbi:MAG: hypothetical protein KDD53_06390, partial [Bdellovibrionales bacterium]|nr:hypothetical protein [Bdellovibrionales bacterium]
VGRGGIVTARGTADGLVIRLDGRVESDSLQRALREFMEPRKGFVAGHEVSLEWVGARPAEKVVSNIEDLLKRDFRVTVRSAAVRETKVIDVQLSSSAQLDRSESREIKPPLDLSGEDARQVSPKSLFDGMNDFGGAPRRVSPSEPVAPMPSLTDPSVWDDPDARMVYTTLRSGQRIETEHSLVIFGDVNPGAEIIAGGDIIVLGTLRGVAHAGAYEETGGGRFIFALSLQPTQLRIGTIISRGPSDNQSGPEIAKIEGSLIVVEPIGPKTKSTRR